MAALAKNLNCKTRAPKKVGKLTNTFFSFQSVASSNIDFKLEGARELLEAAGATRQGSRVLLERYDEGDAGGEEGGGGGGSGGGGRAVAAASAPLLTGLDGEFIQLRGEAARPSDAAADGALGGDPERASLFAFKQLVVVEVAGAASAGAAAAPAEAAAARSVEVEVDVDTAPGADRAPDAFLTLGGPGWARVAGLLGLGPGAAVRFERDP